MELINIILHIDQYLSLWIQNYGTFIYTILFLILFAETGLVVMPLLPGDSLLFAVGALTTLNEGSIESRLDYNLLSVLLMIAVFLGDNTNYFFGRWLGPKVFKDTTARFLNPKHLHKTQAFFAKHGEKAVVIARFMPIVRTFVPFVAGMGRMKYPRYLAYSFFGSLIWIQSFMYLGRKFGNLPQVKSHFHWVIVGVVILSVMPMFIAWIRSRLSANVDSITPK